MSEDAGGERRMDDGLMGLAVRFFRARWEAEAWNSRAVIGAEKVRGWELHHEMLCSVRDVMVRDGKVPRGGKVDGLRSIWVMAGWREYYASFKSTLPEWWCCRTAETGLLSAS